MARNLRSRSAPANGPQNTAPEKPYFDRLVALAKSAQEIREDAKIICTEAKEADIQIGPLKLAVKRHLETDRERNARLGKEEEAERILRATSKFETTPLGEAAVRAGDVGGDPWPTIGVPTIVR